MNGLSVKGIVDADNADLFGKDASDLQTDIEVDSASGTITGTLKYIADYSSAFGGDLASGNYLALHCEVPDVEGVTISVKLTNEATLDEDGNIILRIADKDTQTIKVVASKAGVDPVTRVYSLTGLTCQEE